MKQVMLKVRDMTTGEVVKTLGPIGEHKAEKVLMGMLRNMNTDRYCVDEEEVTP